MDSEKFITLAIHTYDHAVSLRRILESHGLEVRFEKLIITDTKIVSGIRVKIKEHDLPLALKLTESTDNLIIPKTDGIIAGTDGNILIPVDFKPYSIAACKMGFELARHLSLHPVILHAYATPYFTGSLSFDDTFNGGIDMDLNEEINEIEIGGDIRKESKLQMMELRKKIEKAQKEGKMPDLKFSTVLNEGVAEDVIKEYCRITPPVLVVMATRCKQRKGEELIGSVTAEVLDSCRVPVFSIPEDGRLNELDKIRKLVFFCNLDQHDIITVDTLMRMFDYPEVDVTLIPVNERAGKDVKQKVDNLKDYLNKSYPAAHFKSLVFPSKSFLPDFNNYETQAGIDMIIVPNKRRNVFARLLNPGIAHKLLFERDLPLLAIPV